ncbi:hypothetical protein BC829DRAFT_393810 [Chytridium lagenaria]|nr:hypothetical protein BC829DRAFT_393810 [Chytridium lagenaria]
MKPLVLYFGIYPFTLGSSTLIHLFIHSSQLSLTFFFHHFFFDNVSCFQYLMIIWIYPFILFYYYFHAIFSVMYIFVFSFCVLM